jgi:hypothetical protein
LAFYPLQAVSSRKAAGGNVKFRKFLTSMLALVAVLVLAVMGLRAQTITQGDVTGVVTDPTGAVLPNATVTLKSNDTGATQTRTTNSTGSYRFALLPPGNYTLTFSAPNYRNATQMVTVTVGQVSSANIQLAVAATQETVTVVAEAGVVQTVPNIVTTMSEEQIHLVPNGGGDITYIAQTAPGATMNSQGGYGNFSTFGLPTLSNNFTVNSMPDNDIFLDVNNSGATNIQLGLNDIREATIVSNGYSGQYSLGGANVNYVTKSGTNAFHGNAIWWWNGRYVNANNYFNNQSTPAAPRPFVNDNQWAASFGGPIKKDKTFFFVDNEGLRLLIPVTDSINVPSPQFQAGTLAHIASTQPAELPFYQSMFKLWNNAPGASAAGNTLANGGCDSSFSSALIGGAPCALTYFRSISNLTTEWLLTARVDQNIGANDRAFVHFRVDQGQQATYTDPINSAFNVTSKQPQWEGQLQEVHSFSPNTLNSFTWTTSYYSAVFAPPNLSSALSTMPVQVAFPGQGLITSGSFWSLGNNYSSPLASPAGRNSTTYGFVDDASHIMGRHSVKFGANLDRVDLTDFDPGQGSLPLVSGETMADFFSGVGTSFLQFFPVRTTQPLAYYRLGFYGADEWSMKTNLKLTFAMRFDRDSNPTCRTDCFSRLAAPFADISHGMDVPYNQSILAGQSLAYPGSYHPWSFEPRFGFTWSPSLARGTVFSGGFGIFSDAIPAYALDRVINNLPNDPSFTLARLPFAPGVAGNAQSTAAAAAAALTTGFPAGATWTSLNTQLTGILGDTPGTNVFAPPNFQNFGSNLSLPRFQEWDFEIQHEVGSKMGFSAKYVGNHGVHEIIADNGLNAYCGSGVASTAPTGTAPCLTTLGIASFTGLPTAPTDPRFLQMTELTTGYNSNYNGLTVSFLRRLSAFQFQLNYTYSHALDDASNLGGVQIPFNFKTNLSVEYPQNPFSPFQNMYGNSDYDIRHYFSANYVWDTPKSWMHGWMGAIVNGWTVSGTWFWHTGTPYTSVDLFTGTALNTYGYGGVTGAGIFPTLANQTGGFGTQVCNGTFAAIASGPCPGMTSNFTVDTNGFGNQRRNQFYGPRFFDTDMTLMKNFKIPGREGMTIGIGATAYNLFNHPNFDQPSGFVGTSGFGKIVSTVSPPTSIFGSFLGADASTRLLQSQIRLTF